MEYKSYTKVLENLSWVDLINKLKFLFKNNTIPSGNERQVVGYDSNGKVTSKEFNPDMWSDFTDGAPTSGQWLAAAQFDSAEQPEMGFVEVAMLGDTLEYKIPFYNQGGKLNVGEPEYPENAVNLAILDIRIPTAPVSGNYQLESNNGVVTWVIKP